MFNLYRICSIIIMNISSFLVFSLIYRSNTILDFSFFSGQTCQLLVIGMFERASNGRGVLCTRKEPFENIKVCVNMYSLDTKLVSPGAVFTSTYELPAVRPPFKHANC